MDLKSISTSPSSSDEEDIKFPKEFPKCSRRHSFDNSLSQIPEALPEQEFEDNARPRRVSLPIQMLEDAGFRDDLDVLTKNLKRNRLSAEDDTILEESEFAETDIELKVHLIIDNFDKPYISRKQSQLSETIEEQDGEFEPQLKHDDYFKLLENKAVEFPGSPSISKCSVFPPEAIEEEEEKEELILRHDDFIKKIQKGELIPTPHSSFHSALQEVDEESD